MSATSATSAVPVESKSAKKRRSKAEAAGPAPSTGRDSPNADSGLNGHIGDHGSSTDSPYLKEIVKNIRNLHKKLSGSAKADAVVEQNPGVSIDDLVSQKKLNADQKAQLMKKPQLQAQLAQLEDQHKNYQAFAQELQDKFDKEKAALIESHEAELAQAQKAADDLAADQKGDDIESGLTVITGFLHAAAAKRQSEEQDSEEGRAFEGALLLVYQGNTQSLNTLKSLVDGTDEKVVDVEGNSLDYTFAQIKEAALKDASTLIDETEAVPTTEEPVAVQVSSDPTIANAGLTELEDTHAIPIAGNGNPEPEMEITAPEQTSAGDDAGNAAAEASWNPEASITSTKTGTENDFVMVARDPAETETGSSAPAVQQSTSNWADEAAAEEKAAPENDGFEQVRRERGRGRGNYRGQRGFDTRGRGNRGRGEYRGRGQQGRGRGRGDRAPQAQAAS